MRLESKAEPALAMYLAAIAVGALLMIGFRDFSQAGTNALAGFLLGCMLAGLGAAALIVGESRSVELDGERRRIVLEVKRRLGGNRRIVIRFAEVRGFGIGLQGKLSSGTRYYDLIVRTTDGRELALFGGCVFEGRMDRAWIDGLRREFEAAVGAPIQS
jgi:hypothetical protein